MRILNFGKYKGSKIDHIIWDDIEYIKWCLHNVKIFKLNECEQEQFDKKMSIIRSEKLEKEGLKKLEDDMYKKIGGRIGTYDWDYYIEEY